jgi:hypothetical protein
LKAVKAGEEVHRKEDPFKVSHEEGLKLVLEANRAAVLGKDLFNSRNAYSPHVKVKSVNVVGAMQHSGVPY